MYRIGLTLVFCTVIFALPAVAQTEDRNDPLQAALALQQTMQKVIEEVEPSIASIFVSRSDAYQRFGQGPDSEHPGKLGAFDPQALERHPLLNGLGELQRGRIRRKLEMADPQYVPTSFGSGVVLDENGLLLTNYHVVQGAVKIFVRLPNQQSSYADIHAADPRSDLAILKLIDPGLALQAIRLGDGDKIKRGQFVLSLANAFAAGFRDGKPSASWGIVSNVRRRLPTSPREIERTRTLHQYGTLIQTDARLNLGCSGGALIDLHGQLIGLTSATAGIAGGEAPGGFAIPIDAGMRRIIEVLRRGEEIEYAFLGVGLDERAGRTEGVVVEDITPGSPAELAGLQAKHFILSINGTPVLESDDLFLALGTLQAGAKAMLEVRKTAGGRREKVEVTLARFQVAGKIIATELGARPFVRGVRVDWTSILVQQEHTPLRRIPAGVLISEVRPHTPAAAALLRPGEIITHVNDRRVMAPADFYREIASRNGPVELTLAPATSGELPSKATLK